MELYGLKLNLIKERKHREKTIEVNKELMKEKRISQSQSVLVGHAPLKINTKAINWCGVIGHCL